jgi:hypothetical protein
LPDMLAEDMPTRSFVLTEIAGSGTGSRVLHFRWKCRRPLTGDQ